MIGPTQTERVLAALLRAGARGVTQVDFALPDVIDGGKPITRVAARIEELRSDHGQDITVIGRRDRCHIYALAASRPAPAAGKPIVPRSGHGFARAYGCRRCAGLVARRDEACKPYSVWVSPNVAMYPCRNPIEQESRRAA